MEVCKILFVLQVRDNRDGHLIFIMLNVRCKLEQAAPVWHNSLTKAESSSLERVQKTAVRLILKDKYKNYEDALKILKLDNLEVRRDKLTLNLAKSSLKIQKMNK